MDQFEQFAEARYYAERVRNATRALNFIADKIIMGDSGNNALDALYSASDMLAHSIDDLWMLFEKTGSGQSVPVPPRPGTRGNA